MNQNPFISNFPQLLEKIKLDIQNHEDSLFINSDDGVFDKLFIQVLERRIKSKKIKFFAIRNISLKPEFVGLGLFSSFLSQLEELNINLLFHDVVNPNLKKYLLDRNYEILCEKKYECTVISLFKMNNQNSKNFQKSLISTKV